MDADILCKSYWVDHSEYARVRKLKTSSETENGLLASKEASSKIGDRFISLQNLKSYLFTYQWLYFLMIVYPCVPQGSNAVASVYLQYTPNHQCKIEGDALQSPQKYDARCDVYQASACQMYMYVSADNMNNSDIANSKDRPTQSCIHGYEYTGPEILTSVVTEFNLVCEDSYKSTLISVIYFFGFFNGAILAGYLSDNYGRRNSILIGSLGNSLFILLASWSRNWLEFAFCRFNIGMFGNVAFIASFVYVMEFVGPKYRSMCGVSVQGFFAIGYAMLSLYGYLAPDWRDHQRLHLTLMVPTVIFYFLTDESPRWLIARHKFGQAIDILKKVARKNNIKESEVDQVSSLIWGQKHETETEKDEEKYTIIDLFRQSRLMTLSRGVVKYLAFYVKGSILEKNFFPPSFLLTFNLMFNWMVNSITYYGLSLNSAALPTSLYISNFAYGIIELPAYWLFSILMEKKSFGRNKSLMLALLTGGICTLLSTVFAELSFCEKDSPDSFSNPLILIGFILALVGKFSISGSFSIVYNYTAELYPTQVRATAVGICSMASRIGGMMSPVFASLYASYSWLPGTLFGGFAVLAGLATIYLPETLGQKMLMNFEEAHEFYYRKQKKSDEKN